MRVIVTGSRDWTDADVIGAALTECMTSLRIGQRLTVVHGGARGADRIAGDWAWKAKKAELPVAVPEVHLARWQNPCREMCPKNHRRTDPATGASVCPTAGFYRNADMVARGADVLLAFLLCCNDSRCRKSKPHPTHGSDQCVKCARDAGIEIVPFPGPGLETLFTWAR